MKQVYQCDYCDFRGTEEEVLKHEEVCIHNTSKKSCLTCKYKKYKNLKAVTCTNGINIPDGSYVQHCQNYEGEENVKSGGNFSDIFSGIFGGL